MTLRLRLSLLTLIIFSSSLASAKSAVINDNPLTAQVSESQVLVRPGMENKLSIKLNLADGYHAYLERFKLVVREPSEIKVTSFSLSPVVKFMDEVSKSMKDGIKDRAELNASIMVPEDFGNGVTTLVLALTYQACREDHCLFPKTIDVKTQLNTSGVVGPNETSSTTAAVNDESKFSSALKKGFLSALLLAFIVGLGTSFTPCIYPMIPITLAVLGARKEKQSHLRGFLLALCYVLGIAITYSILGLIAASTGGAFGRALGNIYVISGIAAIFALMGLSMYGLIEIQVPQFIQTRLGFAHQTTGFLGAFTAGLAAGVVASPCVGPVLISILAYIAQSQNLLFGFVFLFIFALGIGFPFLILGTFSQLISHLPKAGSWMEFVKFVFGSLMIAMGFYYIHPLYPAWLFNLLVGVALIFIASLYGAFETVGNIPMSPEASIAKGAFVRFRKGLMLAVLVTGVGFFADAVLSRAGVQLASSSQVSQATLPPKTEGLPFEKLTMDKLYVAQKEHKPIMIDFGADWCAACTELKEKTFPDFRVQELGKNFALFEFDATDDTPEVQTMLREFKVIGLPTIIFFDRNGNERKDQRLTGFEEVAPFVERMKAVLK